MQKLKLGLSYLLLALVWFVGTKVHAQTAHPTATLTVSPSDAVTAGTPVTLVATVSGLQGVGGTVNFCNPSQSVCVPGDGLYGTAQVTNSGNATLSIVFPGGTNNIKAVFLSNTLNAGSQSGTLAVNVTGGQPYSSTTTIAATGSAGDYTLSGDVSAFGRLPMTGGLISFLDTTNSNVEVASTFLGAAGYGVVAAVQYPLSAASPNYPQSIAMGDFNGDGIPDMAVANQASVYTNMVAVFLGNGDGTFTQPAYYAGFATNPYDSSTIATAIASVDINNDGKVDLIVVDADGDYSIWLGNGDGTFHAGASGVISPARTTSVTSLSVADVDGDGIPDIAMGGYGLNVVLSSGGTVNVAQGNGTVVEGDFTRSGVPEIAWVADSGTGCTINVFSYSGSSFNLLGGGSPGLGRCFDSATGQNVGVAVGDFNQDGILDLVIPDADKNAVGIFLGRGDGTFQPGVEYPAGAEPKSVSVGDFNGDGVPDLLIGNYRGGGVTVLSGTGSGSFGGPISYATGSTITNSVQVSDVNSDGIPDVIAGNGFQSMSVLLGVQTTPYRETGVSVFGVYTHYVLASYSGDGLRKASESNTVPLMGVIIPTITTVVSSQPTAYVGSQVIFTATVTSEEGVPTGGISLFADGNLIGAGTLSNGSFSVTNNSLAVGVHQITASYAGSAAFAPSASKAIAQTITPIPTNTVVTANPSSSTYLQCTTFTATVTSIEGTPNGNVLFTALAGASSISIGTGTLNGAGVTTTSSCSLNPASYTVKAAYAGTTNFAPSSGTTNETVANLRVVVVPPTPPSNPPFHPGVPITIPVSGFPTPPGGAPPTMPISIFGGPGCTTPIGTVPSGGGPIIYTPSSPGPSLFCSCYPGDANYADTCPPTSPIGTPITINVTAPTALVAVANPNPATFGNTVTVVASVSSSFGTPTGSVACVADSGTSLGSAVLNASGTSTLIVNGLAVGSHAIACSFTPTGYFDPSTGGTSLTINPIPTNTVVAASPSSSTYLQCITFTATVTAIGGNPTGNVVFTALAGSSTISIGTGTLNGGGVTTASSCSLSPASYTVKAAFAGSTNFAPSSGITNETVANLRVVVVPPTPPSNPPFHPGVPITIPVSGFPTPPGGAPPTMPISIFGGATGTTPIGTVPSGGGPIIYTPGAPGPTPIWSCYPGDANYADTCPPTPPIGTPVTINVTAPTTLVAVASPNPATFGNTATVTATVSSSYGTPTGSVACVADSGTSLGSAVLNGSGTSTLSVNPLAVGSHPIACSFTPTGYFDPTTGGTTLVVNKATPTVAVSFSPEPSYPGDAVSITATVTGVSAAVPGGRVTFTVDGVNAGSATLASGSGSVTMQFASVGSHTAVATYSGDGNYLPATGSATHAVVKLPTTTTVSATPDPAIGGQQSITLLAVTIYPDLPFGSASQRYPLTGSVQFYDNGVLLGTVSMDGATEQAQLTLSSLSVGSHSLTSAYSGDVNYLPSSSATGSFTETMLPPISGLVVTGNADASANASVTYNAHIVNPLGVPQQTGTVTWTANGTAIGTSPVSAGTTTFSTTYATPGNYAIVASYVGEQQPGTVTFSQNVLSTGTDGSAPFILTAPPTVSMATDGTATVALSISSAGVGSPITLTCSGAPVGYSCNLTPATLNLSQGVTAPSIAVTITHDASTTQAQERASSEITVAGMGLGLFALLGVRRRRKTWGLLLCVVGLALSSIGLTGCGAGKQYASYAPQNYTVTVTAAVESYKESVVVNVTR